MRLGQPLASRRWVADFCLLEREKTSCRRHRRRRRKLWPAESFGSASLAQQEKASHSRRSQTRHTQGEHMRGSNGLQASPRRHLALRAPSAILLLTILPLICDLGQLKTSAQSALAQQQANSDPGKSPLLLATSLAELGEAVESKLQLWLARYARRTICPFCQIRFPADESGRGKPIGLRTRAPSSRLIDRPRVCCATTTTRAADRTTTAPF